MARTRPLALVAGAESPTTKLPAFTNTPMTAAAKQIFPNRKMVIAYDSRQAEAWCVDDTTEILTQRGWMHREQVSRDDIVYTLNHNDGTAGWEPILDMATFDVVDEPMLSLEMRHHSSLTTMAHRWPVFRQTYLHTNRKPGSSNRAHRERAWTTSADLYAEDQLVTAAPCRDLPTEAKYSDAFVELVAWFWTEGGIRHGRTNPSIRIYQSESANPGYVARIQRALTQIFGEPHDGSHPGRARAIAGWRKVLRAGDSGAVIFQLNVAASEELLRVAPGKVVSLDFLRELTESQLRLFLDVSVMADGTVGVTPLIYQKNPAMLDPYLFACVMAGLTPHVWLTKSDSEWSLGNDKWRATALPRSVATPRRKRNRSVESYTGKVWCPVTPSGTWMARRNGTVWFTGNTAWDREGELYTLIEWLANMVSRCRLVIAEVNDGEDEPTLVESGPAVDVLARLGGGMGGHAQLLQEATLHLSVPGIGWLVGEAPDDGIPDSPDFERWVILSADEIRPARRKVRGEAVFEIREGEGGTDANDGQLWRPLSPDSLVVRFWRAHPRFCVDDQTEILTQDRGWVTHDEATPGDIVLTLNHDTGLSEWQPILAMNRYSVTDEPMLALSSYGHSSVTTLNHRWPVLDHKTLTPRWRRSDALKTNDALVAATICSDIPTEAKWEDSLVEMVGWWWTEGSVRDGSISQSPTANPEKVVRIRAALTALFGPAMDPDQGTLKRGRKTPQRPCSFGGCEFPVHALELCKAHHEQRRRGVPLKEVRRWSKTSDPVLAPERGPAWREYLEPDGGCIHFRLNSSASAQLRQVAPNRIVRLDWIRELTMAQLHLFLETSIAGDGHRTPRDGATVLAQSDPARVDPFEYAAILAGYHTRRRVEWHGRQPDENPKNLVALVRKPIARADRLLRSSKRITYTGTTWCPTTANGTWCARRDGKVHYTGNSGRADSPTLHALGALFELDSVNKRITATGLSRLAGPGILLYDKGRLSIPDQGPAAEGMEAVDPFAKLLVDVASQGIADPASPAALLPIPVGYDIADLTDVDPKMLMQVIKFSDGVGPELIAQRDSAVKRVTQTMPVSPERLTGLGGASHWGASQIEESDVKAYVSPTVEVIAYSWTVGFLYPLLKAGGNALTGPGGGRLIIWYDPSEITSRPDKSQSATEAYDRFEVSGAALRRENGLDDDDAPNPAELNEMMLKRLVRDNPGLAAAALKELGGPELTSTAVSAASASAPAGPVPVEVPPDPTVPDTRGDDAPSDSAPAPTRR